MKNFYSSLCYFSYFLIISLLLFFSNISNAQENKRIYHPLSGSILLSLDYSETISETDYTNSIFSFGWRTEGEYFLPIYSNFFAGIRIYGGSAYLTGKEQSFSKIGLPTGFRTTIIYEGGGFEYGYRINEKIYPYIFVGGTNLFFDPKDFNGHKLPNNAKGNVYSRTTFNPNIEFGFRYFFNDQLALNASFTQNFNSNDYLDDLKRGKSDTYSQINIGLSIALFAKVVTHEPNIVIPEPIVLKASIPEPKIFKNELKVVKLLPKIVNLLPDVVKSEPKVVKSLPKEVKHEKETVKNEKKEVKHEPREGKNEHKEVKHVAVVKETAGKFVFASSSIFTSGSAYILPSAYSELNKIAGIIESDSTSRWRIEGFTDSKGASSLNRALSFNRANAIYIYFIYKGLNQKRFVVKGDGNYLPYVENGKDKGNTGVIISKIK